MRFRASISSISDLGPRFRIYSRRIRPSTITRLAISSRLFAGSMIRPLRMIIAFMSGERTLVACWSPHSAATNFYPTLPQSLIAALI